MSARLEKTEKGENQKQSDLGVTPQRAGLWSTELFFIVEEHILDLRHLGSKVKQSLTFTETSVVKAGMLSPR